MKGRKGNNFQKRNKKLILLCSECGETRHLQVICDWVHTYLDKPWKPCAFLPHKNQVDRGGFFSIKWNNSAGNGFTSTNAQNALNCWSSERQKCQWENTFLQWVTGSVWKSIWCTSVQKWADYKQQISNSASKKKYFSLRPSCTSSFWWTILLAIVYNITWFWQQIQNMDVHMTTNDLKLFCTEILKEYVYNMNIFIHSVTDAAGQNQRSTSAPHKITLFIKQPTMFSILQSLLKHTKSHSLETDRWCSVTYFWISSTEGMVI